MRSRDEPDLLERARAAKRESQYLDFKESFDPDSGAEFIELIKDLVALANSGGGVIVIGVRNNATLSGIGVQPVLDLDPAKIADKVFKYTGEHFPGFAIHEVDRAGRKVAAIVVEPAELPLVFTRPGTYAVEGGRQKSAFAAGTTYVRHGAKSEPATARDLGDFVERRLDEIREQWLGGIRKVFAAPSGSDIGVYERTDSDEEGRVTRVRLTNEPDAPVFGRVAPDQTHPYRQKEVVREVNKRLEGQRPITRYDVQAIRASRAIDSGSHPEFCHKPRYGSQQYSETFVDWIRSEVEGNSGFIDQARDTYYDILHS